MAKQIIKFYATKKLKDFLQNQGKPKEIELLLTTIMNKYGSGDNKAFRKVCMLLDDETLVLLNKLYGGIKK